MAAKSSQAVYAYAVQTAKGVIPTGTYTTISRRSGGFSSSGEESSDDGAIGSGGLQDAATLGKLSHTGSLELDFIETAIDPFLESAYAARWDTGAGPGGEDVLTLGVDPLYMTFVVQAPYLEAARQYTRYSDCLVSSLGLTFPKDGSATIGATVALAVANREFLTAPPWTTLADAPTGTKLRTCDALRDVEIDDVEIPSIIDSMTMTVTRETESVYDLRQCDPAEVIIGKATVDGTLVALHDDDSDEYHRDAAQGDTYKFSFRIDSTNLDYTFLLPTIANRATGPDFSGENVTISMPFGATGQTPVIYRA